MLGTAINLSLPQFVVSSMGEDGKALNIGDGVDFDGLAVW